ncbi:MAG TPA: LysM peptidoglycan-binding domain-containing protein [Bacillota bacterium]|nr:LysM peptidoglycan-binding domain-containing protein [Bacillota bacterium]
MNWRKKFGSRTAGIKILFIFLLSLNLFGSFGATNLGAAEVLNNNGNKPAMVANLEFVNMDLRQVFHYLANAGGFQALLDPGVQGVVNIAFKAKAPAKDVATALATSSGFNFKWLLDGATLFIGNSTPNDTSFEKKETRSLTLKYLNPALAADSLTAVVPRARINFDASAKTKEKQLTISANELEWQNISEIIQELDRPLPQLTIESRIVELPETYFKELDRRLFPTPTQMGAFPLTNDQARLMESHNQFSVLYHRESLILENQAEGLTLEDQISKVIENSQEGSVSYQIENLAVGIHLSVALHPGPGSKLILRITQKVETITNTNPPKNEASYLPMPGVRELTSIIPWEPGQKILLTGTLQRNEFNQLLNIPYKFPVLNGLFLGKNIIPPPQNTATQVVIIMNPQNSGASNESVTSGGAFGVIKNVNDAKNVVTDANIITPSPTGSKTATNPPDSDFDVIPGAAEEKESLKLGSTQSGKITPTPTFRPGSTQAYRPGSTQAFRPGSTTPFLQGAMPTSRPGTTLTAKPTDPKGISRIQYMVKKGDTLTRIAAKFGVTVQAVISENNLELSGVIKIGETLIIPVNSDRVYTIKPKETLWRIAKRYGSTLEELKDLNGIADIKKVEAGQQIILPVPVHQIKNPQF